MKILLLCNKSPWPPTEGGPMAMHMIISGLLDAGHEVKVLAINSNKFFTKPESIPEDFRKRTNIEFEYIDLSVKAFPALMNFVRGSSYHVQRFISGAYRKTLLNILQKDKYDIVQLETLFMAPYIPLIRENSNAAIILRAHNIEHLIWKRIALMTHNPLKKIYLRHVWRSLMRYELEQLPSFDGLAAITESDAGFFRQHCTSVPVQGISFGIDIPESSENTVNDEIENSVFHIGSMDWMPNQEGIRWFLKEVWPGVMHQNAGLRLFLAGRNMPEWLANGSFNGVTIVGEVEDAGFFMRQHNLMVVPLLSGSGIRIKIIEGMANSRAIITTPVGAEGIDYIDGEHLKIARNADEFVNSILQLAGDSVLRKKMGENALRFLKEKHDKSGIIQQLLQFYKHCTAKKISG